MPYTVSFADPTSADLAALKTFAALLAGTTSAGAATDTPTAPADYFPADPALAPFPSPENSEILFEGGTPPTIGGNPYLKDSGGSVHMLKLDAAGVPRYFINNTEHDPYGAVAVVELIVRQGMVYLQIESGQWQDFIAAQGTIYNTSLPPAFTTSATQTAPALPSLPAPPTPSVVAPGSSGRTINCGTGQALSTITAGLAAAAAGDTVIVAPSATAYKETPPPWSVPIHLIGTGVSIDCTGMTDTLAQGKGCLVPMADSIIEGFTISGVALDQTSAQSTAAVRPDAGCGYLTINDVNTSGNQNGVCAGGFACAIVINGGTHDGNGLPPAVGNGMTHNIYISSGPVSLTLSGVTSRNPLDGHALKCRAPELVIHGGEYDAANATAVETPDGQTVRTTATGVTFNKPAGAANHGVIGNCVESTINGAAGWLVSGCTINALCDSPLIQTGAGTMTFDAACIFTGNPVTAAGGGIVNGI